MISEPNEDGVRLVVAGKLPDMRVVALLVDEEKSETDPQALGKYGA